MTIHTPHPDTHEHGLQDGCPRCAEHAIDPVLTLDDSNLRRVALLALNDDRFAEALTHTDLEAAAKVLSLLERVGHLSRIVPEELLAFLGRYGTHAALTEPIRFPASAINALNAAALRDLIATEREQGRAFGPLAEACRDELAKRTGSARV